MSAPELHQSKKSVGNLVGFHTLEKLLLMAHSPKHYREMGRLVAEGKQGKHHMAVSNNFLEYVLDQFKPFPNRPTILSFFEVPPDIFESPEELIEWPEASLAIQKKMK